MADHVPHIHDKTPRFSGLLQDRRNLLMVGGSIVVLVIVVLVNAGAPSKTTGRVNTASSGISPAPPTPEQVKSFQAEIQRETAALAKQQQQASDMRDEAQRLAAGQAPMQYQTATPVQPPPERKHESNVALSFRSGQAQQQDTGPLAAERSDLRALLAAEKQAVQATLTAASPMKPAPEPALAPAPVIVQQAAKPAEKTYKLFEGTLIETVLTNRLNGTFVGPVSVLVTTPVYSHDHQHVLIPQGSRILGEAQKVGQQGQQRLAVVFHRCIMPDGYSLSLDEFTGLNQVGEAGLKDKVDQHWRSIFGTSLALGLVSGFSLSGTGSALTSNGVDQYRQGVASSVGQSSTQVLSTRLNVFPTITIREGHRVRVWLRQDIDIPAYDEHRIAGDL